MVQAASSASGSRYQRPFSPSVSSCTSRPVMAPSPLWFSRTYQIVPTEGSYSSRSALREKPPSSISCAARGLSGQTISPAGATRSAVPHPVSSNASRHSKLFFICITSCLF